MLHVLFGFTACLPEYFRPGQQILYKGQTRIVHVLGNFRQRIFQILIDIQIVGLGGFHQAVDHGTGLHSVDGTNDVPVGSANGERPDGPLCSRVINGDLSVLQKYLQIFFLIYAVLQTVFRLLTANTGNVLFMNPREISLHKR